MKHTKTDQAADFKSQKVALLAIYFQLDAAICSEGACTSSYFHEWQHVQTFAAKLINIIDAGGLATYLDQFIPRAQKLVTDTWGPCDTSDE